MKNLAPLARSLADMLARRRSESAPLALREGQEQIPAWTIVGPEIGLKSTAGEACLGQRSADAGLFGNLTATGSVH